MRSLVNKGFETIEDDLQKHATEYRLAHVKTDARKPGTIAKSLQSGNIVAEGSKTFRKMKNNAKNPFYKATAVIHPGAGSEEDDTTPDWLKTFYLRQEV